MATMSEVEKLLEKWRDGGTWIIPPCMECFSVQVEHKPDCSYGKQPQPASDGALEQAWENYRHARWLDRDEEWSHHWKDVAINFATAALASPPQPASDGALEEAAQAVIDWEIEYRTLNHLGKYPPSPFIQLAISLASRAKEKQ